MGVAQSTGEPVPVEGMITPTEQTLAMPDGSMQYEASSVPVRVEQGGVWVPIDTTLALVGEWFEPVASIAPVRFSPGGTDQLGQVQTETGGWVTERWPYGILPTPTLDGDTATYAEVLPGVDLKMIATKTGQASVYVVKTEAAAQSTNLDDLHVIIENADLTRSSVGAVKAELADGSQIIAGQPLWWDSSDGGNYREPGGEFSPSPVTHDVEDDRVLMDVGASVAVEEKRFGDDVTYPIYVDPDWSSGIISSWYTDLAYPNQSYLTAGDSDVLRVGIWEHYRSDMFFEFPLTAVTGKVIKSAVLNTTQLSVNACGNLGAIQTHTFGPGPAGFTWNQEQTWTNQGQAGWSAPMQTWVGPGCGSPAMAVGWNVTSGVQEKAKFGLVQFAFTFSNSAMQSRRHYSRAATLIVSYNTLPNTPTAPLIASPPRACGTATAPAAVGQSNVTASVQQTDPDGEIVGTNFYLARASNLNVLEQELGSGLSANGTKMVTFTGLVNGVTYAWRGRGQDYTHHGTEYTAWCYFTVDTTKPAVPTVTASAGAAFAVGQGVGLSVTGAADVAGYVYWVTPGQLVSPAPPVPVDGTVNLTAALPDCNGVVGTSVRWACASSGAPSAITVAPTDGLSTAWVSAYDKAGNQSAAVGFPLYAGGNASTPASAANLDAGHAWQVTAMTSPLPNTLPDSNPWIGANALNLVIPATSSTSVTDLPDPPLVSPVLSTAGAANEQISTSGAPVDARNSFSLSFWVKVPSIPATGQIVALQSGNGASVQLQLTNTGAFAFCLGENVISAASTTRHSNCATGGAAVPGQWQMVTGIWDSANSQLRLLVGNRIDAAATNGHIVAAGNWSAAGPLAFGPVSSTSRFEGLIVNPIVVPGVIDHAQLARLAAFELPFTD